MALRPPRFLTQKSIFRTFLICFCHASRRGTSVSSAASSFLLAISTLRAVRHSPAFAQPTPEATPHQPGYRAAAKSTALCSSVSAATAHRLPRRGNVGSRRDAGLTLKMNPTLGPSRRIPAASSDLPTPIADAITVILRSSLVIASLTVRLPARPLVRLTARAAETACWVNVHNRSTGQQVNQVNRSSKILSVLLAIGSQRRVEPYSH